MNFMTILNLTREWLQTGSVTITAEIEKDLDAKSLMLFKNGKHEDAIKYSNNLIQERCRSDRDKRIAKAKECGVPVTLTKAELLTESLCKHIFAISESSCVVITEEISIWCRPTLDSFSLTFLADDSELSVECNMNRSVVFATGRYRNLSSVESAIDYLSSMVANLKRIR